MAKQSEQAICCLFGIILGAFCLLAGIDQMHHEQREPSQCGGFTINPLSNAHNENEDVYQPVRDLIYLTNNAARTALLKYPNATLLDAYYCVHESDHYKWNISAIQGRLYYKDPFTPRYNIMETQEQKPDSVHEYTPSDLSRIITERYKHEHHGPMPTITTHLDVESKQYMIDTGHFADAMGVFKALRLQVFDNVQYQTRYKNKRWSLEHDQRLPILYKDGMPTSFELQFDDSGFYYVTACPSLKCDETAQLCLSQKSVMHLREVYRFAVPDRVCIKIASVLPPEDRPLSPWLLEDKKESVELNQCVAHLHWRRTLSPEVDALEQMLKELGFSSKRTKAIFTLIKLRNSDLFDE